MGIYATRIAPHPACGHLLPAGEADRVHDHTVPGQITPGRRLDRNRPDRRQMIASVQTITDHPLAGSGTAAARRLLVAAFLQNKHKIGRGEIAVTIPITGGPAGVLRG